MEFNMIDQLAIDSKPDCESVKDSSLATSSNGVYTIKHSNRQKKDCYILNKLTKKDSTDSGYGSSYNYSFQTTPLRSNGKERLMINENTRYAFGSLHETDESSTDLSTTSMSFSREVGVSGNQVAAHIEEELSSSSFSSTSRASLDAPSSSPSFSGDHIIPFQNDSSGSL